ncbi:MAG TPA: 4Fe-4S ferredoxin [Proteobacteria bacterium]|nr:4Fe-4S ferredoxin [Pseudomonadota bacterium]
MKILRKIIRIDEDLCDGCGRCVPACDEGAIQIIDGKARVVAERYCDGLGACLGECPQGAIAIVERMADDFDPDAVEEYLKKREQEEGQALSSATMACGCPSTKIQTFAQTPAEDHRENRNDENKQLSSLGHWPVQIRLIPAHAPFLEQADLLILADCAAVAYASLHRELLPGRVVMMGCPKFDDLPAYEKHFAEIFTRNHIKSVTVVTMEVPCCSGLPTAVKMAIAQSKQEIPCRELVINLKGEAL